jgi:pyruvate/2-oxoglutarate dehydrogenase complex dihydrolipoamide acyltransferase (E2) component
LYDVEFPRLADTLVEGTITAWYKRVGDLVKKGEPLFAVETEKVNADVESPAAGTLGEILIGEGAIAQVGQVIARIGDGSGAPVGVHSAMTAAPVAAAAPAVDGLGAMRRRIAERMLEAKATIAQGSCTRIVDLSGIDRQKRSWTAYFVKALAVAADIRDIGVAVEIPGGLVVPVVHDALGKSVDDISAAVADLGKRARENALTAADVTGGSFTVTNVGATGTLVAFPLINPGQPGILAPGAIVDGRCWLTLCYDRAKYDEYAADQLLREIENRLIAL